MNDRIGEYSSQNMDVTSPDQDALVDEELLLRL